MTASDDRDEPTRQRAGLTSGALAMLSREAGRAAMLAATAGLSAWEQTRGLRELALRRADEVLQIVAHTPLGRFLPHPLFDDGADAEAERIAEAAKSATLRAVSTVREHEDAGTTATKPAPQKSSGTKPAATKSTPTKASVTKTSTPKAAAKPSGPAAAKTTGSAPPTRPTASADDGPSAAAVEAGAPGANTEQVEQITAQLSIDEPSSREDLPIRDFDNISLGSLRARLRSLSLEDLVTLREWEQAHAHRLPVVTLLDNRIAKVSAEQQTAAGNGTAYPAESTTQPTADRSS
jgi:hypothetical protein